MHSRPDVPWRNQFLFNLALARNNCGVELSSAYNLQLNVNNARIVREAGRLRADWDGKPVAVIHFNGNGRNKCAEWRGIYSRVPDPLPAACTTDDYALFLNAFRAWAGLHGLQGLTRAFYGAGDGRTVHVSDTGAMALLATLHHVIRSTAAARVLENRTGCGVLAACVASAIAHRAGGRVVTFDSMEQPERNDLWDALPKEMRASLDPRLVSSLEGMTESLQRGERFDAALLGSLHNAEQAWAEFELASRLVCERGLILIQHACSSPCSVCETLSKIRKAGYDIVTPGNSSCGIHQDDEPGLALIENRMCRC
jgi:hypothetical protein